MPSACTGRRPSRPPSSPRRWSRPSSSPGPGPGRPRPWPRAWSGSSPTGSSVPTVTADLLQLAGELGEHLISTEELAEYTKWMCSVIENAPRAKGQRAALPQKLTEIMAAQHFRLALLPLVEEYHRRKRNEGALDF